MSWLSDRVEDTDVPFAAVADGSRSWNDTSLRVLEMPEVMRLAGMTDMHVSVDPLFAISAFVLFEEPAAAAIRMRNTRLGDGEPVGPFTLAIRDARESGVIYLPEDLAAPTDCLSLFAVMDGRLRRLIARGLFDDKSALVDSIDVLQSPRCPEGPCLGWGAGCGGDCTCMKFEIKSRTARAYGLRCQ